MSARWRARSRRTLLPLALGVAALAIVYGRFIWQARHSIRSAEIAVSRGGASDRAEATRHYLDALRAYVPGSPLQRQALDGLAGLAAAARAAEDTEGERHAWEAVRMGLLGTRSLYMPYGAAFAEANRQLAQLDATAVFPPRAPPAAETVTTPARGHRPGGRSVRPPGPAVASTLIALIGFAVWIGATVLLIR
ncbi:MAG: hypothetical protein H7X95_04375, partial [Deltaproteobacteria bacterium]|nr:hypothetical protein [Deltaproteobacteria bacterium]